MAMVMWVVWVLTLRYKLVTNDRCKIGPVLVGRHRRVLGLRSLEMCSALVYDRILAMWIKVRVKGTPVEVVGGAELLRETLTELGLIKVRALWDVRRRNLLRLDLVHNDWLVSRTFWFLS